MDLTALVDEKVFLPRLMALQECLCAELEKAGGPAPCFCGLVPAGRPPLGVMNCAKGDCGVAWVSPVNVFPYGVFPMQNEGAVTKCASPMAMRVQIGVARCHPKVPQGRTSLDPQQAFDATRLYLSDMAAAKRALLCCFPQGNRDYQVALESWEPLPAEAGVAGGIWSAVIG